MLTLYMKPGCPFCGKVLQWLDDHGVQAELRDITAAEEVAAELEEKGGKRQVPFLVDEGCGMSFYESDAIVAHLSEAHA